MGTMNSGSVVCRSRTRSALVFNFVSSHGSASQLLVKFWKRSGSSLLVRNALTISENRTKGL